MSSGYKTIDPGHRNYNQLYSLALLAAVNRLKLRIRTQNNSPTAVQYLVIDW